MNPSAELLGLLEEWRRLTEEEGHSIGTRDWNAVAAHQGRKQQLCAGITQGVEQLRMAAAAQAPGTFPNGSTVEQVLAELTALETRNRALLAQGYRERQAESQRTNETVRNLEGVRRAYGETTLSRWQSYS